MAPIKISPPIIVRTSGNNPIALNTVEQVIDYARKHDDAPGWEGLRDAAFVAAAVPSPENIEAL